MALVPGDLYPLHSCCIHCAPHIYISPPRSPCCALYCCCWTRSDVNAACGQLALDGKKEEAKQKAKKARVIQKKLAEEERERLLAEMRDEEDSSLFMDERGPLSFASMPTIARCADSKHGMVGGEGEESSPSPGQCPCVHTRPYMHKCACVLSRRFARSAVLALCSPRQLRGPCSGQRAA